MTESDEQTPDNPYEPLAKIMNHERVLGLIKEEHDKVEKNVNILMFYEQGITMSSLASLLDSRISMLSFQRFLENAARKCENKNMTSESVATVVKREREPSSEQAPPESKEQKLERDQQQVKDEATQKAEPIPISMGGFSSWSDQIKSLLRINDNELWPDDSARKKAVIEVIKKLSKNLAGKQSENFLRFFINASSLPMKNFWDGLHKSLCLENVFGLKWGNLRLYGGWPGFDRLELRMNTIAKDTFNVENSWEEIQNDCAFLNILCAMTPAVIWKWIMEQEIEEGRFGINNAKEYLEQCIKMKNASPPDFADRLFRSFGVPMKDVVDRVGMGTLVLDSKYDLNPENDTFIYNPLLLTKPKYYPSQPAISPLLLGDEEIDRRRSTTKPHREDLYGATHWGCLRLRGGWPGFNRLSYRMDMIAREAFKASNWRELNVYKPFLHTLAAMTPAPIWAYLTSYCEFETAEEYYNCVMEIKDQEFAQPRFMKNIFGIPLPAEVDRTGFGTQYLNPRTSITKNYISNPMKQIFPDMGAIKVDLKSSQYGPLIRNTAGFNSGKEESKEEQQNDYTTNTSGSDAVNSNMESCTTNTRNPNNIDNCNENSLQQQKPSESNSAEVLPFDIKPIVTVEEGMLARDFSKEELASLSKRQLVKLKKNYSRLGCNPPKWLRSLETPSQYASHKNDGVPKLSGAVPQQLSLEYPHHVPWPRYEHEHSNSNQAGESLPPWSQYKSNDEGASLASRLGGRRDNKKRLSSFENNSNFKEESITDRPPKKKSRN